MWSSVIVFVHEKLSSFECGAHDGTQHTQGDLLARDTFVRQKHIGHDSKEIAYQHVAYEKSSPSGSKCIFYGFLWISMDFTAFNRGVFWLPWFNSLHLGWVEPRYRCVASKLLPASCREASARDRTRSLLQFCPKHLIHTCPPKHKVWWIIAQAPG